MMSIKYFLLSFIIFSQSIMATEEPNFELIYFDENLEIREYEAKIMAQVRVEGDFEDASSKGFKTLADFIFGNNIHPEGSKKIAMTAPVEMSSQGDLFDIEEPLIEKGLNNNWLVNFIMPASYSLQDLPKPNNNDVSIIEIPKETYAVVVFSGLVRADSYNEKVKLLNEFILMQKLEPIGAIKIARYNPPWTLPFFRRNELMVKINPNIKSLRQMDNEIKNQE